MWVGSGQVDIWAVGHFKRQAYCPSFTDKETKTQRSWRLHFKLYNQQGSCTYSRYPPGSQNSFYFQLLVLKILGSLTSSSMGECLPCCDSMACHIFWQISAHMVFLPKPWSHYPKIFFFFTFLSYSSLIYQHKPFLAHYYNKSINSQ